MARKCVVTGRGTRSGNQRSHAMNSNKRKWKANVAKSAHYGRWKTEKVYVSARALKSGKVERV